jgi:hypothetical protein
MSKGVPILSIVAWLGFTLIITITIGPFSHVTWFMGRFVPTVPIYNLCGIILAAVAGIGGCRWAHFASLALSVPASLWAVLGFFTVLGFLIRPYPGPNTPVFLWICLAVILLMICMPIFWAILCYRMRRATAA